MGKGSNTTTNSTTSAPDAQAAGAYRDILSRAQGVASTPYQAYQGDLTAPVNAQQNLGISNINANANYAAPNIAQATGLASGAANPLTAAQIQQYQNPFTQNVVDATQAQFDRNNAQQQAALTGNQISQGALGGNRTGVAQANLSSQQATQQNPIIAGLYDKSYQQGLATAGQQFQQNPLAASNAIANYGISGQGAALSGAGAQLGAGTLQQQTEQQRLSSLYGQYAQAQAYPYQQTQWLAGIGTGVGSQLGGTSNGQTTAPAPNPLAQILGGGLAAAGTAGSLGWKPFGLASGGVVHGYANGGGVVPHMAEGGMPGVPWSNGVGWIPQFNIHPGSGAPHISAPGVQQIPAFDPAKFAQGLAGKGGSNSGVNPLAYGVAIPGAEGPTSVGGAPLVQNYSNFTGTGVYARGGGVAGYAGGGGPNVYDENRVPWADSQNEAQGMFGEGDDPETAPLASRFGNLPAAQQNLPFQDAYIAKYGVSPQSFAGDRSPEPYRMPDRRSPTAAAPTVASADDDEEITTPAAKPTSGAGSGVAAFAPQGSSSYAGMPDAITQPKSSGISPNVWTGLTAAGLSMLASRSPNFGNAIGEGGLAGLSAYGTAEQHDQKVAAEAEKLAREARKEANDLSLRKATQAETGRHNLATEKNAAADKTPAGMQRNKDGSISLIPGFEEATSKLTAAKTKLAPGSNIDPETADFLADRLRNGDTRALQGLGHGLQGSNNILEVQRRAAQRESSGVPISDSARSIQSNVASNAGLMTAERTQAAAMAKLSIYGRSAFNATKLVEQLSNDIPRTQFPPINAAINAYKTKTGDPKIVALGQAITTLTNEYARAIGGGHGTVHDKEVAEQRLSAAQTPEQLAAVVDVMRKEITLAEHAMPAARQQMREIYAPNSKGTTTSIEGGTNPSATGPGYNLPPRVIQNGHTYERQPDGSYKAVQ